MKKFFVIFIGMMLIVPEMAKADPVQYVSPATASSQEGATVSSNAPKYDLNTITVADQGHIASAAYVKGAHNSAISAINYLSDSKQEVLNSGNNGNVTIQNSTLPVVTGISADGSGEVIVTKGEISVPVGAASGNNVTSHASIWVE